jgi:hypothetical protein
MITKKEFISFQDSLYLIRKVIKEEHGPVIDTWKEHLRADIVLRKDGLLFFLERVLDVEPITD